MEYFLTYTINIINVYSLKLFDFVFHKYVTSKPKPDIDQWKNDQILYRVMQTSLRPAGVQSDCNYQIFCADRTLHILRDRYLCWNYVWNVNALKYVKGTKTSFCRKLFEDLGSFASHQYFTLDVSKSNLNILHETIKTSKFLWVYYLALKVIPFKSIWVHQ